MGKRVSNKKGTGRKTYARSFRKTGDGLSNLTRRRRKWWKKV